MKFFRKYKFLKYTVLLAVLDMLSKGGFAIGGGVFCLISAIVAVVFMEKMEKDEKKEAACATPFGIYTK